MVDVIVAVHNEEQMIAGKLRELETIDYPADKMRFIIVDGGSSDATIAAITAHANAEPRSRPVLTRTAWKTAQLNEGLGRSRAPWVLVTDADARVPPDTLRRLLDEVLRDPRVGVVGTTIVPHHPHPLDHLHWRVSNWVRRTERRSGGTSGLVGAPCYLFRRDLIAAFPEDVIADDVHVVCRAATQGATTAIIQSNVTELRVAPTTSRWFQHKVRRTLGYLREVFRFAPGLIRVPAPMRAVLLWRSFALTIAPATALVGALLLTSAVGLPFLAFAALLLTSAGRVRRPPASAGPLGNALVGAALPVWIILITCTALVLYPFVRQSASYSRLGLKADHSGAWS